MVNVAVLDDYQSVALQMADWRVLPPGVNVQVFKDHLADMGAVGERLGRFEIVCAMRERTPFRRDLLERLPNLRLLVTTGRANAAIDLEAATRLGIIVSGTQGLGYPTAELTWGLILALTRNIVTEDAAIRRGLWQTVVGVELREKVLGVVGLGRLGSQVAGIGKAFGMEIIAWSQNLTREKAAQHGVALVSKEDLFARSDIVTVHLVLSARTRGLVGARELGLMKSTAYLVNTSRGPIVDEAALVKALGSRTIAGAGLDTFDEEPLAPEHPFKRLDNTVLTPHIGYVTRKGYELFFRETVEDVLGYLKGQPARVLNPDSLARARPRPG